MQDLLLNIEREYTEVEMALSQPDVVRDNKKFVVDYFRAYQPVDGYK